LASSEAYSVCGLLIKIEKAQREKTENEFGSKSLYETLIEIRIDYQSILGQIISKVHFNTPGTPKEYPGIPPLIKLDMMIHMYFPSLTKVHKTICVHRRTFWEKMGREHLNLIF